MPHGHSTIPVGTPPFNPQAPDPRRSGGGLLGELGGLFPPDRGQDLGLLAPFLSDLGASLSSLGGPLGQAATQNVRASRNSRVARAEALERLRQLGERRQAMRALKDLLGRTAQVPGVSPHLSPSGAVAAAEEPGIDPLVPQEVPFVQTPEGQRQLAGIGAQLAPENLLQSLLSPAEPSGFEKKAQGVARLLGRQLTQAEILGMANTGVQIQNIPEDRRNQPIPISELRNLRDPKGNIPSVGTTFGEAQDQGVRVVSTEEGNRLFQKNTVDAVLDQVERIAFGTAGDPGIFVGIKPGLVERTKAAGAFAESIVTQDDPRVAEFRSLVSGQMAGVVRFLGERGALNEGDVRRAQENFPSIFPPDTEEVARRKMRNLRKIINKGFSRLESGQAPDTPASQPAEDEIIDLTQ